MAEGAEGRGAHLQRLPEARRGGLRGHGTNAGELGIFCGCEIYERFAFFLVYTYKISANRNTGSFLAEASALNHLGAVMQLARAKFEVQGSADIKLFFTCVDPNSKSKAAMWFKGVKYGLRRAISQRAMKDGDDADQSATPIHLNLLKQIVAVGSWVCG